MMPNVDVFDCKWDFVKKATNMRMMSSVVILLNFLIQEKELKRLDFWWYLNLYL